MPPLAVPFTLLASVPSEPALGRCFSVVPVGGDGVSASLPQRCLFDCLGGLQAFADGMQLASLQLHQACLDKVTELGYAFALKGSPLWADVNHLLLSQQALRRG